MFDYILEHLEKGSQGIAHNMAAWNIKIFGALVLVEVIIMVMAYALQPEKIEELPVKFYKLLFFTFVANTLFMWLPTIWVVGWDTVNYLASLATGEAVNYSPSELLAKAFSIMGDLQSAAWSDGGWNLAKSIINALFVIPISFAVFFLFLIIIAEVVINYVMWVVSGAMGGIFILLFVLTSTRPMFYNYIKYMFGLLFKTLTMFLMLSMLMVILDNYVNFNEKLGPPPTTQTCDTLENLNIQASKCTTTDCKNILVPQIQAAEQNCNREKKDLEAYEVEANKGFIARGLTLLMALFIFVMIFKTIPSAMASLVGFGSYEVKGMMQAMGAAAGGAAVGNAVTGGRAGAAAAAGGNMAKGAAGAVGSAAISGTAGLAKGAMAGAGMGAVDGFKSGQTPQGKVGKALGGMMTGAGSLAKTGMSEGIKSGAKQGMSHGSKGGTGKTLAAAKKAFSGGK